MVKLRGETFRDFIIRLAKSLGWRAHISGPGFPNLVLACGGVVLILEVLNENDASLKTDKLLWFDDMGFRFIESSVDKTVWYRISMSGQWILGAGVIRPKDHQEIRRLLTEKKPT